MLQIGQRKSDAPVIATCFACFRRAAALPAPERCTTDMIWHISLWLLVFAAPLAAQQRSAEQLLRRGGFRWQTDTSDHFILHIDSSARAARADLLHFRLDRAHQRARTLVGTRPDSARVHVFMVGS